MPVAAINFNRSHLAADSSNDTPADLPSERARFADELGRETALVGPQREPEEVARVEPDRARSDEEVASKEETSKEVDSEDDTASDPVADADELTRMLALLGLAVPPASQLPVSEPPMADASDTRPEHALVGIPSATAPSTSALSSSAAGEPAISAPAGVASLALPLQHAATSAATSTQGESTGAQGKRKAAAAAPAAAAPTQDPLAVASEPWSGAPSGGASAAAPLAQVLLLEVIAGDGAELQRAGEDAPGVSDDVVARMLEQVRIQSAFGSPGPVPISAATTTAADSAKLLSGAAEPGRSVALTELPRAMLHAVDTFVRLRSHGGRWEAQIRLDPPELGTLHVRLELDGDAVRGVVHYADRRLEPELGRVFQEVEESLRQQGGDASFELKRRAQEEEREREAAASEARETDSVPVLAAGRAPRSPRPDPRRLVDLLA